MPCNVVMRLYLRGYQQQILHNI